MRLFLYFLLLTLGCNSPTDQIDVRPNILFLIADDWSYPHASALGDHVVSTPTFDYLAQHGALFNNAYCAAPSCSPSRASILTGRYPHQLESGGNLWSVLPSKYPNWVSILNESGYHTGKSRKGWGPGDFRKGGYIENPAGKDYPNFSAFIDDRPKTAPFCYWFGSTDPHRDYEANSGARKGLQIGNVKVPGFMPDQMCVRNDMLDYYYEVERFDQECGDIIDQLREMGELENTMIIMTSDNGMPFPRAKANLYDYGTRMPMVAFWADQIQKGNQVDGFVNFVDLGPTILEATGQSIPKEFSGVSFLPALRDSSFENTLRDRVYLERERHANVRKGDLSYPSRALRTHEYLYIRNYEPDRWPAGDPETHQSVGQFGDVDNSISKFLVMDTKGDKRTEVDYFDLTFGKRPFEELYQIQHDPYNLKNLASDGEYYEIKQSLANDLDKWMVASEDLRSTEPNTNYWDTVEYTFNDQRPDFKLSLEIDLYERINSISSNVLEFVKCRE